MFKILFPSLFGEEGGPGDTSVPPRSFLRVPNLWWNNDRPNTGPERQSPKSHIPGKENSKSESQSLLLRVDSSDTVITVDQEQSSEKRETEKQRNEDSTSKGQSSFLSLKSRTVSDDQNSNSEEEQLLTAPSAGCPSWTPNAVEILMEGPYLNYQQRNVDSDDPKNAGQSSLLPSHPKEVFNDQISVSKSQPLLTDPSEAPVESETHSPISQQHDASDVWNSSNDDGQQGCGVMACFSRLGKCRSDADLEKRFEDFLSALYEFSRRSSDLKKQVQFLRKNLRNALKALNGSLDLSSANSKETPHFKTLLDKNSNTLYFLFHLLETVRQGDLKSNIPSLLSQLHLKPNCVLRVLNNFRNAQQIDSPDSIDRLESEIRSFFFRVLLVCSQDIIKRKIRSLLQLPGDLYDLCERLKSFLDTLHGLSIEGSNLQELVLDDLQDHPFHVFKALKWMCDVSSNSKASHRLEQSHENIRTVYFLFHLLENDLQCDLKTKIQCLLSRLQLEENELLVVLNKFSDIVKFRNSQQTGTVPSKEQSSIAQALDSIDSLESIIRLFFSRVLFRCNQGVTKRKIWSLLQLPELYVYEYERLKSFLLVLSEASSDRSELKKQTQSLLNDLRNQPEDALREVSFTNLSRAILEKPHDEKSRRTVYFLYQLLETDLQGDMKSKIKSLLPQLKLQAVQGLEVLRSDVSDESEAEQMETTKTTEPPSSAQDSVIDKLEKQIRRIFLTILTETRSVDYIKRKTESLLKLPIVSGSPEERFESFLLALLHSKRVSESLQKTIRGLLLGLNCSHPGDVINALRKMCEKSYSEQQTQTVSYDVTAESITSTRSAEEEKQKKKELSECRTLYFLYQLLETDIKSVLNGKIKQFNVQSQELLDVLCKPESEKSEHEESGGDDMGKSGEVSCFSRLCKCGNDSITSDSSSCSDDVMVERTIRSLFEKLLSGYAPGDVKSKIRNILRLPVSCCTKFVDAVKSEWYNPFSWFTVALGILSIFIYILDVGTDVRLAVDYFLDTKWIYGSTTAALVIVPSLVACCVNLYWYHGEYKQEKMKADFSLNQKTPTRVWILRTMGCVLQFGPVVRTVEYLYHGVKQVRRFGDMKSQDAREKAKLHLCMFEGFLESAPQLLFQLYFFMKTKQEYSGTETAWHVPVTMLISWASLALNVVLYIRGFRGIHSRRKTKEYACREEMKILNTVVHFFWRLCETGCRVICLAVFASTFDAWVFGFIAFHVAVVSIWLCVSEFELCTKSIDIKKVAFNIIFGYMMLFCYVTDPEVIGKTPKNAYRQYRFPTRFRYLVFYAMFYLENFLMFGLWFQYTPDQGTWYHTGVLIAVPVLFVLHVIFQLVYYTKKCHPNKRIGYCHQSRKHETEKKKPWNRYDVCGSLCCIRKPQNTIEYFKKKYACKCNCCSRGH